MSIFKGAGVAIVTPMKNNEEVNYDRLEQMIEYQINQGTDCIIIAGTTGESSTLTTEEHAEVIKAAVKFAKHRIPVVAEPVQTVQERQSTFRKKRKKPAWMDCSA